MAIKTLAGLLISYDSEKLIDEMEGDLEEFGDFPIYAYVKVQADADIVTDWDFKQLDDKDDVLEPDPGEDERVWDTMLSTALEYVKLQDDPLKEDNEIQNTLKLSFKPLV